MNPDCGCCDGISALTPEGEANRAGLPALTYRVGTYATFFETMVARLSSLRIDGPVTDGGTAPPIQALAALTTRAASDPALALLDAWAVVADVLTFYQERIANEGYLPTATERRSVLELARLVGYRLRPGVSASVYLAFTVANGFRGVLPAGTRAQSIPGAGATSQFFETSADLAARESWNTLLPRLARPQVITLASSMGTDAATRATLYLQGIASNLKAGDPLLIVLGDDPGQQVVRFIAAVDVQADQNRTELTLQDPPPDIFGQTPQAIVESALQPYIDQATAIFAESALAGTVAAILSGLIEAVGAVTDGEVASDMVAAVVPKLQEQHDIALRRNFTRLQPWIAEILAVVGALQQDVIDSAGAGGPAPPLFLQSTLGPSALANLAAIVEPLARPASLQPANGQRLVRSVASTFSAQGDTAPRLLAHFQPAIASTLYRAWTGIEAPARQATVYALRVKAAPYGNNAPRQATVAAGAVPTYSEWPLSATDNSRDLWLDASYDKIVPGTWVVIDSPGRSTPLVTQANAVQPASRADYGMAARVTQLTLADRWLTGGPVPPPPPPPPATPGPDITELRSVTVWAQPELLALADEPLDADIGGNTIELAQVYDGLESGRWIIVSGERTDIPSTTGVIGTELVMISAVTQGARAPLCVPFPPDFVPFAQVFYTTDANSQGDRLVVGALVGGAAGIGRLKGLVAGASLFNQQFCDQAELAPGLYVNAYVPSADELAGSFPDFAGLLVDPATGQSYRSGVIPPAVLGQVFAWRFTTTPVQTILTLANALAYTYDRTAITVYGNVAGATHGQTVGEILGDGDGSQSLQAFPLHQAPLTYVSAATPDGARSTLVLRVNELQWQESADLASLGSLDRAFITQTDDADTTLLVFGNGVHGARLPTGASNVKAVYRYGIGAAGNVDAGQISQLATHPLGAQSVVNPLAASGGADRDSLVQARLNAPLAVMALDRLVSVQDYADFARTFAGVGKASSARLSDGRRRLVHVTIAGAEDIPIAVSSDLYRNLTQALQQFGDPHQPIQVAVRKLKVLVIAAGIRIGPAYLWESVETKLRTALVAAYSFDQRTLGQSAFLSEAIAVMQAVDGVAYVDVRTFDAVAEDVTAGQLAGLARTLTLNSVVAAALARVDRSASDAARRILPAELVLLTPDIPDTLILTEIAG